MEESIGKVWNKILDKKHANAHESERVFFSDISKSLKLFYHLLGGDKAKEVHVADKRFMNTKRSMIEKVTATGKSFFLAWQDDKGVYLPASLACFATREQNTMHYYWLIALSTHIDVRTKDFAYANLTATKQILENYAGFRSFYTKASQELLRDRRKSSLYNSKYLMEEKAFINSLKKEGLTDALSYKIEDVYPYDLWLYPPIGRQQYLDFDEETPERVEGQKDKTETLEMKKKASQVDDKKETDGMLVFLPDSLMSIMEQVNVDRSEDDSFDEDALYNAEDLDEITLGRKKANLASRLKMDLDLEASDSEEYPLGKGHFVDEWDYRKNDYLKNYACIKPLIATNIKDIELPTHLKPLVRKIQSELDLMELDRVKNNRLPYGDEINIDTWIQFQGHQNRSSHHQKFYESFEKKTRDISTLILADVSLSTEAGITQETRIIDMIKDGLMVFSESLNRLQDQFSIYAFSSLKNKNVRFHIIKNFKEAYSNYVRGKIDAMKPGYYTRLGAAIRESSKILEKQQTANKLMLIISDGKPNDVDRYDGRYGIEDTKKAIQELRKKGITPFCVTIDLEAKDYLSYLFGKGGYALVRDSKKLPKVLPEIYMNLTK
jgi:nitric oxide reductase NorD protein